MLMSGNCWRAQAVSSFVMPWERKLEPIWEAAAKRPRLQIKGAQMPPVPIEAQAAPGPPKPKHYPRFGLLCGGWLEAPESQRCTL